MSFEKARLRAIVDRSFRVYDVREEKHRGQIVAVGFCLMAPKEEFDARYEAAHDAIVAEFPDLLVFVKRDGGEDILFVAERPQAPPQRQGLRIGLFVATLITTILAGAYFWAGYNQMQPQSYTDIVTDPNLLFHGFLTFALPLLLILGVHETAHFVAARRHRLRATLPLFIPAPPLGVLSIGTFGAFISLRDPIPDRKAMFDVGASGPLAGFLVAVPIIILGCFLTATSGPVVPDLDRPNLASDGAILQAGTASGLSRLAIDDPARIVVVHLQAPATLAAATASNPNPDWDYVLRGTLTYDNGTTRSETIEGSLKANATAIVTFAAGAQATRVVFEATWDDHLIGFGDPLLVTLLRPFFNLETHLTHPVFFAGWVGLLITGINLLPAGQLDGGHVGRAVFGAYNRFVAYAAVGLLFVLALGFSSWTLMALFVLFTGIEHPPPLNDRTPLDAKRKIVAAGMLLVLVLTFVPVPFSL